VQELEVSRARILGALGVLIQDLFEQAESEGELCWFLKGRGMKAPDKHLAAIKVWLEA